MPNPLASDAPTAYGMSWLDPEILRVVFGSSTITPFSSSGGKLLLGAVGTVTPSSNAYEEIHDSGPFNDANGQYKGNMLYVYTHRNSSADGGFGNFFAPTIAFNRSEGSEVSPAALSLGGSAGDTLAYLNWNGFDGISYVTGCQIVVQTGEVWNSTHHSAQWQFNAVLFGTSSAVEVMRFPNSFNNAAWEIGLSVKSTFGIGFYNSALSPESPMRTMFSELGAAQMALGNGTIGDFSGSLKLSVVRNKGFTVTTLPVGAEGDLAYATNGRKVGEGAGLGTGVPVYFSNGSWRVFSTDAAVAS